MKLPQIYEILELADKAPTTDEAVATLRKYDSATLRLILQHAYDPSIKYKLPEGIPPYTKSKVPIGYAETNLYAETRRLGYLFHNPPAGLNKVKLEGLFISMLEAMHPGDSSVIVSVKDKNLTDLYPKVTEEVVRLSFPELLPAPVKPVEPEPVVEEKKPRKPRKASVKKSTKKSKETQKDPKAHATTPTTS